MLRQATQVPSAIEDSCQALASGPVPRHIAVIPDGNRRWAKQRAQGPTLGHKKGADTLMDVVEAAQRLGVRVLTLYTFSTENWRRPAWEVEALMNLLKDYLIDQCSRMQDQGVRFDTIGYLDPFPDAVKKVLRDVKEKTKEGRAFDLVLALNYGARDELARTVRLLASRVASGTLAVEAITEQLISETLDTASWGDPDLLIRAGGELRLSNFLLWQMSYAEMYVTNTLWPDFTPQNLLEAICAFQSRERRLGGGGDE